MNMEKLTIFSIDHCDGASEKVLAKLKKIKIAPPCIAFVEHTKDLVLQPEKETNFAKKKFWKKIISFAVKKGCDVVPLRVQQKKRFFVNPDSLSEALINIHGEINDVKVILRKAFKQKQKIAFIGGTHAESTAKELGKKGMKVKIIRTRDMTVIRIQALSAKEAIYRMLKGEQNPKFIRVRWGYKITGAALKKMKLRLEQVDKNPTLWKKYNKLCNKIKRKAGFKLKTSDYKLVTKKQKEKLLEKAKIIKKEFNKRSKIDHPLLLNSALKKIY